MTYKLFDDIAHFVLYKSNHGDFLKKMADAWLHADNRNKAILKEAWATIIVNYDLNAEYVESRG